MIDPDLVRRFERDMEAIYDKAKAIGYNASRYLLMLREHGGLETAHRLLAGDDVSYGFTELWLKGRSDLTVEALALQREYEALFTDVELSGASARLGRGTWHRSDGSGSASLVSGELGKEPTASTAQRPASWTVDRFAAEAMNRGPVARALAPRFLAWTGDSVGVGDGESGPLYFLPETSDTSRVHVCSIDLDGMVLILMNEIKGWPPFDKVAARIRLQGRLNRIVGFDIRDEVVEAGTWQTIDGGYLLSPGSFEQFAATYDWVASQLASGTNHG
jgi:hypothetical protein